MLELHEINRKISSYFESADEFEMLHKALKKQNSHLIYFEAQGEGIESYCEKYRLNPESTILCTDLLSKDDLYNYLHHSQFKNYLILQQGAFADNYTQLNFLIFLQRHKFKFKTATFNPADTFRVDEIEKQFQSLNIPSKVQKNFSLIYNELVMNAMIHGKTAAPELSYTMFSDYLIFQIKDHTGEFNFSELDKVFKSDLREVNPGEMRTAGIGLNMVFKYTSGLAYDVIKGQSTQAIFFLNLNRSSRDCGFIYCRNLSSQEQYPQED